MIEAVFSPGPLTKTTPAKPRIPGPYVAVDWAKGPVAFEDLSRGREHSLWGMKVTPEGRVFYARWGSGVWGQWVELLTLLDPITSVVFSFDKNGAPLVVYRRVDRSLGAWRQIAGAYQLEELAAETESDAVLLRTYPNTKLLDEYSDLILAYLYSGVVVVKKESEGFTTENTAALPDKNRFLWLSGIRYNDIGQPILCAKG